ncbi:hypothetical protein PHYSODRAFT_564578 [Phytophthora sojae]|uniref:START domain-containing protein n=1 Tax=Phytophthora sojae (strain P6497) TaxID=1094619 RepID=G5A5K3_PHYSP|nr:hypothetical protein PHYSODRAFT_564578 [Phytophthora sojae]EGZ08608.1 hypothetical protein PHYSODRAFT_564578 [Phytophthora sojae]|eukprot:XP_009535241.1 hypothetical protein PHYSODRAFT_564578 [Phytophthora sojae]
MSGLTPTAFGGEPSGLQDVLAFIADFEMEHGASSANHDSDDWMEDESDKVQDVELPESFVCDGGRRPSPTGGIGPHQALLLSTSIPGTSMKSTEDGATKTPRRHRVSRKEELEYLRKKVTDMEDKLKQLKSNADGGGSGSPTPAKPATPEDEKAAMQLEQSIALWKKMAQRQKSQRELVELENAKLREKLKTQVRMAKSLQRILRKCERAAEQPGAYTSSGGDFDELVQSLEALYSLTNERIATCPIATGAQPLLREQDVKYNDFTGMFLEFQHSKLVPFDIAAVNRAVWRLMSEPGIKFNTYFEEFTEVQGDVVLRKFGVEIKQGDRLAQMTGRQALKRYFENSRVVIVRNSNIDRMQLADAATGGLGFRDVGWLVLKDVTGMVSASGPMTLIQSYSTLTPDVDLDAQWEVGALTDFAPGRTRVSRKEELEYLRLKVKEMEAKLRDLKGKSDGDRSPPPQTSDSLDIAQNSMHVDQSLALWKSLAERQKSQRELVEVENAKLREKLKTQVRMAKSLKRILCKRTRDEELVRATDVRLLACRL